MDKIEVTQDDKAYAKSIVDAVEGNWTYEDRCLAVRDLLARHRLATRTDATPVAWMYYADDGQEATQPLKNRLVPNTMGWTELPLYTHPPATDVAALVEADIDWRVVARLAGEHGIRYRTNKALVQFFAALAPFTKGQNDDG